MRKIIFVVLTVIFASSSAYAQNPTPGYYLIYGNRDGSTIDVNIDSDIEIKVWVATPSSSDSVYWMHMPLATNDSIIVGRNGYTFYPPILGWRYHFNYAPNPDTTPGYTNQSFLVGRWGPPFDGPLDTDGDTIHIATFHMHTGLDSSLTNEILCPFIEGYHPDLGGLWWLSRNEEELFPLQTFSCLYFAEYLAGDANRTGDVNGLDVLYMVGYLKGFFPPPDPIFAGDANGDCLFNGLDVTYLAAYLKGIGREPFLGNCH